MAITANTLAARRADGAMEPSPGRRLAETQPRLNPFALPSDTSSRFALLIVAVLASSLFVFNAFYLSLPSSGARYEQARFRCPGEVIRKLPESSSALDRERARVSAVAQCVRSFNIRQAVTVLLAIGLLVLVALGLFALTPRWKIRRRRLVQLDEEDAPEVCARFSDVCREAGLSPPPVLLWNPLAPRGDALAFGRFQRWYVAVGAGLVVQFYSDPEATTAVLRHEVAHVTSRDVTKTYFAVSLWNAFVLVGILPFLALELSSGEGVRSSNVWRAAGLALLVYAVRNSVLRAREYYADAWAASSPPARMALARILDTPPMRSRPALRLWRVHPDPSSRLRALGDSAELFRLRCWDALAAGVFAGFAFPTLTYFLFLLVPVDLTLHIGAAAGVVSASLMGAVLGTTAWRAGLAARVRGGPLPGTAPFAAAAAVGFVIGYRLSFTAGTLSVGAIVFLGVFSLLTVHWVVEAADAWFDVAPRMRSGALFAWAGPLAAGVAVWITGWFSVLNVASSAGLANDPHPFDLANVVAVHAFTPYLVMGFVVFPLAPWLLRRRMASHAAPRWVVPDTHQDSVAWPEREPLALASALRCGALGGGIFFLVMVALDAADVSFRVLVGPVNEAAFQYAPGLHYAEIALAVVAQAAVASVVAVRAKRLPVVHALFILPASFPLMTFGVFAPDVVGGEGFPPDAWESARLVLAGGAFAGLALGGAVHALRRLVYRDYRRYESGAGTPVEPSARAASSAERSVR